MTDETPSAEQIDRFLRDQYRLWSEDKVDEMLSLFEQIASAGYTIEYVGSPVQDGPESMAAMVKEYRGKVRTHVRELIVNGSEAAAVVDNEFVGAGQTVPSIETYSFENGRMKIRYFHQPAPG